MMYRYKPFIMRSVPILSWPKDVFLSIDIFAGGVSYLQWPIFKSPALWDVKHVVFGGDVSYFQWCSFTMRNTTSQIGPQQ